MKNLISRFALALPFALALCGSHAHALSFDGDDEGGGSSGEGSGPPSPPVVPALPQGQGVSGTFFLYPQGNVIQGGIGNGQVFTFGGGAGTPYIPGQTVSYGDATSHIGIQATLAPIASVTATASQDLIYGRSEAGIALDYTVTLHAANAGAAAHISDLLKTGGAIATVTGNYTLSATGYGYSSMGVRTGTTELAPELHDLAYASCGSYGVVSSAGTPGCASGSFSLAVNFVSASSYSNGNPLDFISAISLSGDAHAGTAGADFAHAHPGSSLAFVDPTITLANGIQGTLTLGDGSVSNLSPVPEPSSWALFALGLAVTGSAAARRRRV